MVKNTWLRHHHLQSCPTLLLEPRRFVCSEMRINEFLAFDTRFRFAIWVHLKLILFSMSLAIYAANAIIGDERLPQLKATSATSSDARGARSWGIRIEGEEGKKEY